jgi:hypothetical protein
LEAAQDTIELEVSLARQTPFSPNDRYVKAAAEPTSNEITIKILPPQDTLISHTKRSNKQFFKATPDEIVLEIFSYLDPCTSTCLGLTCKQFYAIHTKIHGKASLFYTVKLNEGMHMHLFYLLHDWVKALVYTQSCSKKTGSALICSGTRSWHINSWTSTRKGFEERAIITNGFGSTKLSNVAERMALFALLLMRKSIDMSWRMYKLNVLGGRDSGACQGLFQTS